VRRGADVTFVANPFYESRVTSCGSRFVAAGEFFDVFAAIEANPHYFEGPRGALRLWRELVAPSVREIYPVALDAVRQVGAGGVVSHLLSFGGAWAARAAVARSIVVSTTSSAWLSRHEPVVFAPWRAPRPVQGVPSVVLRTLGRIAATPAIRRLAADVGAPRVTEIVADADLNLGTWPEWFRRPVPDDPPRSRLCGFVFDTDGRLGTGARGRRLPRQRRSTRHRRVRLRREPPRRRPLSRRGRRLREVGQALPTHRRLGR